MAGWGGLGGGGGGMEGGARGVLKRWHPDNPNVSSGPHCECPAVQLRTNGSSSKETSREETRHDPLRGGSERLMWELSQQAPSPPQVSME